MNRILLGSAIAVLLLSGCTEDKKEASNQTVTKEETTQKINETSNNTVVDEKKKAQEVVKEDTAKDKKNEQVENKEEITVVTPDGETLYKVCASCHGQKAEKEALGKSQVIAGWDKERIIIAMNGYKDGTYGGIMKNIMKPQVETKTDEEIEILATYISNIK
ncbi:c-type cytochrome [Aliarcobacter butzleri]|uniref:c-type cytochrome n=1 Tax=Aliarcobacter butzleri TaxID=28197 RepID=UPI0021B21B20|nr:c-type cytochrome [Aliarcobacter butzleri]MCT7601317.1 hypothetical protein [Aliarcobacter butzleri]MCT7605639.1 hypothetical protein [Aliarcobacter butzleri]MCT7607718.1 hypothetical protein [Aliarcobacter butzleri]